MLVHISQWYCYLIVNTCNFNRRISPVLLHIIEFVSLKDITLVKRTLNQSMVVQSLMKEMFVHLISFRQERGMFRNYSNGLANTRQREFDACFQWIVFLEALNIWFFVMQISIKTALMNSNFILYSALPIAEVIGVVSEVLKLFSSLQVLKSSFLRYWLNLYGRNIPDHLTLLVTIIPMIE